MDNGSREGGLRLCLFRYVIYSTLRIHAFLIEMRFPNLALGFIGNQMMTQRKASLLLCGNILRKRFNFGISEGIGDPVHDAIRTVGAITVSEIDELPANVILMLAANDWKH